MASFGSSTINKSGKRFTPKAVPRRAPSATKAPAQSSARASTERRSLSQTPTSLVEAAEQTEDVSSASAADPDRALSASTGHNIRRLGSGRGSTTASEQITTSVETRRLSRTSGGSVALNHQPEQGRSRSVSGTKNYAIQPSESSTRSRDSSGHVEIAESSTHLNERRPKRRKVGPEPASTAVSSTSTLNIEETSHAQSASTPTIPTVSTSTPGNAKSRPRRAKAGTKNDGSVIRQSNGQGPRSGENSSEPIENAPSQTRPRATRGKAPLSKKTPGSEAPAGDSTTESTKSTRKKGKHPPGLSQFRVSRQPPNDFQQLSTNQSVVEAGPDGEPVPEEQRRRRKRRAPTPENAENVQIATSVVRMADLCKDLRIGKKSKLAEDLAKLDWQEAMQKERDRRMRRENAESERQDVVDDILRQAGQEAEMASQAHQGPQMRLVNGQLVVDDASLQVDRHEMATRAQGQLEEIEESDLTRRVNSSNWLKREKTEAWSDDDLALLYQGLRMFGTDFEIIAKMFPTRSRRQIKLRYNKEERTNLVLVREALGGVTTEMDLAVYSRYTGRDYADPSVFAADLEERRRQHDIEQKRLDQEREEEARRQREANEKTPDPTNDQSPSNDQGAETEAAQSNNENPPKGKKGKAKGAGRRKRAPRGLGEASEAVVVGNV